jgi:hypothetical protein
MGADLPARSCAVASASPNAATPSVEDRPAIADRLLTFICILFMNGILTTKTPRHKGSRR